MRWTSADVTLGMMTGMRRARLSLATMRAWRLYLGPTTAAYEVSCVTRRTSSSKLGMSSSIHSSSSLTRSPSLSWAFSRFWRACWAMGFSVAQMRWGIITATLYVVVRASCGRTSFPLQEHSRRAAASDMSTLLIRMAGLLF